MSKDDKARIVEETLVPGAVVSDVARSPNKCSPGGGKRANCGQRRLMSCNLYPLWWIRRLRPRLSAAQLSALFEGLDWRLVHEARETVAPMQAG